MLKNFLTVFSATAIAVFPVFAQDSTHEEQKEQDKITISTIAPQLSSMYNNRLVSVKYKFKPGKTGYKPNSPGFFCRICGKIHKLNTDKLIFLFNCAFDHFIRRKTTFISLRQKLLFIQDFTHPVIKLSQFSKIFFFRIFDKHKNLSLQIRQL